MFLLRESLGNKMSLCEEKDDTGIKRHYIQGIYMQAEVENHNGRIYPADVLRNATNTYIEEKVKRNQGWGELSHPESPEINPDRIAIRILNLTEKGNDWIGKSVLITENPCGAIVLGLMNSGGEIGVSSRALGTTTTKNGIDYVDELYICTAADIVLNPSAPDAFVQCIFENKEWVWSNHLPEQKISEYKKLINKSVSNKKLNEQKIQVLTDFIKQL